MIFDFYNKHNTKFFVPYEVKTAEKHFVLRFLFTHLPTYTN